MNRKFITFVVLCCYVLVFFAFLFCAFALFGCLDIIGTPPECSDVQLAYFGVGLFVPCFCSCLTLLLDRLVKFIRTVLIRLRVNLEISKIFRSSSSSKSDSSKGSSSPDLSYSIDD